MVSTPDDCRWLLETLSNMYLYDFCTYVFAAGIILLLSAMCVAAFNVYSSLVGIVFAAVGGALGAVLLFFFRAIDSAVAHRLGTTVANGAVAPQVTHLDRF